MAKCDYCGKGVTFGTIGRFLETPKVHAIGKNNFKKFIPLLSMAKNRRTYNRKMKKVLTYPKEFLRATTTKIFKPLTFSADSEAL